MTEWLFERLGWRSFQDLCAVVLSETLGQTVESFEDGNDEGRDAAFTGTWSDELNGESLSGTFAIQCKFKTAAPTLSFADIEGELAKIGRLYERGLCDNYVLMTNARVSGQANARIREEILNLGVNQVRIWGRTWLSQKLDASSVLRRLVPRVYGLGDLTEILDERRLAQARSVLTYLGSSVSTFVGTSAFGKASDVLTRHGSVMLLGGPTVGKSVIAQMLTLGAIDGDGLEPIKSTSPAGFLESWNPNTSRRRVFWIDDAFGELSLDSSLVSEWVRNMSALLAARSEGDKFIFTSRDYIYRDARALLKESQYRLWADSSVEVLVGELTSAERQRILYSHIKLGDQLTDFKQTIKRHLNSASQLETFTPGLAFRLGHSAFTGSLDARSWESVRNFFDSPADYLREILAQLSNRDRAALAMVFSAAGELTTPLLNPQRAAQLLDQFGSNTNELGAALAALDGTFLKSLPAAHSTAWTFSHPTIRQATNEMLRAGVGSLAAVIQGTDVEELLPQLDLRPWAEIPTEDRGRFLAVEADLVSDAINKFTGASWESALRGPTGYRLSSQLAQLLTERATADVRRLWAEASGTGLAALAGRYWERASRTLVNRLHLDGSLPSEIRLRLVGRIRTQGLAFESADWLVSPLLTEEERHDLGGLIRETALDFGGIVDSLRDGYEDDKDPEGYLEDLRMTLENHKDYFESDPEIVAALEAAETEINDLEVELRENWQPEPDFDSSDFRDHRNYREVFDRSFDGPRGRNVFDDVDT